MNFLTRHEQQVLSAVLALLVLGFVVKVYRAANPSDTAVTVQR